MKIILIILVAFFLAFGCLGNQETPAQPTAPNQTKPITITVSNQTNQIAVSNQTIPTEPDPIENPVNTSLDPIFVNEPNLPFAMYFINLDSNEHGNAVLIKKGDLDILIDAGSNENSAKVVDFLRSKNVDDLEVLVSSNGDQRNYGGINRILETYTIENFWYGEELGNELYSQVVDNAQNEARKSYYVSRGFVKEYNGIRLEVLNPEPSRTFGDVNNDGIIIKVTDRNFSALLLGSAQTGIQGRLLNEAQEKINDVPVIQAPYYGVGSGTSNIGIYLIKAKPKNVIITGSSIENAENGGSRDPFRRLLDQYKIKYHEVYRNGSAKVLSNGLDYAVTRDG